jgi:hypothetical protein
MQVTASDGDKDRPENIVYFLTGQGIDPDRNGPLYFHHKKDLHPND